VSRTQGHVFPGASFAKTHLVNQLLSSVRQRIGSPGDRSNAAVCTVDEASSIEAEGALGSSSLEAARSRANGFGTRSSLAS
jgi:hypothetical protein